MSRRNPFVDPIPGFFSPVFGELLLGGNCETVDADPNADPFDKEICRTFQQFNERFMHFSQQDPQESEPGGDELPQRERQSSDDVPNPESLKRSILNREEKPRSRGDYITPGSGTSRLDEDLDSLVQSDPSLLDEVLQQKSTERESPHMKHYHSYSSVVVTRRPDGTTERRVTKRDSEGNEEVTVTYSDGHESHSRISSDSDRDSVEKSGGGLFSKVMDWVRGSK